MSSKTPAPPSTGYLIAFEKGTLDDEDTNVRDRLAPPQTLTAANQTKIRDRINEILASDVPNARKAMCEALIQEIAIIADDAVRPIFKLPIADNDEGLALDGPAMSSSTRFAHCQLWWAILGSNQ